MRLKKDRLTNSTNDEGDVTPPGWKYSIEMGSGSAGGPKFDKSENQKGNFMSGACGVEAKVVCARASGCLCVLASGGSLTSLKTRKEFCNPGMGAPPRKVCILN